VTSSVGKLEIRSTKSEKKNRTPSGRIGAVSSFEFRVPYFEFIMHSIRLRDFWDTSSDGVRTTHARKFGRPRTADPGERVWLVCASVPGPAEVSVNGRPVGTLAAAGPFAADVTDLLLPRNVVAFAVESDQSLGEVAVEIRAAAN
jgi:hypothetical protein